MDRPCPPPSPPVCPQVCPPAPPPPPCRVKPIMRGLHWSQTTGHLSSAISISLLAVLVTYFSLGRPRIEAYKDYYRRTEIEEMGDEMARLGLFNSVPAESLKDYKNEK